MEQMGNRDSLGRLSADRRLELENRLRHADQEITRQQRTLKALAKGGHSTGAATTLLYLIEREQAIIASELRYIIKEVSKTMSRPKEGAQHFLGKANEAEWQAENASTPNLRAALLKVAAAYRERAKQSQPEIKL